MLSCIVMLIERKLARSGASRILNGISCLSQMIQHMRRKPGGFKVRTIDQKSAAKGIDCIKLATIDSRIEYP